MNIQNYQPYTHRYQALATGTTSITGRTAVHHQGLLFPEKLFQMLQYIDLHAPDLAHIVSWQPHGRCFHVRDPKVFEEFLLPVFFKGITMHASFRRQLNFWGFKRLAQKTSDQGAYYHDLFLRSKLNLSRCIYRNIEIPFGVRRAPYIPASARALADASNEPDFFSMVSMPPSSGGITSCNALGVSLVVDAGDALYLEVLSNGVDGQPTNKSTSVRLVQSSGTTEITTPRPTAGGEEGNEEVD